MSFHRINRFKVNIKNFKIIKKINEGGFGVVYEVEQKETHQHFAAKIIWTDNTKQGRQMINREVQIMIRVVHPALIGFHGFSPVDFDGNRNITIFMDLMEKGSLEKILGQVQNSLSDVDYDNTARQIILVGIAYGMMSLHQNSVIHRDLKPGNILIDHNFYPHITDFGLSKFIDSEHSKNQSKICGTPIYMAPEVIEGKPYNGKADVYSFGIIMYQILTDTRPYPLFDSGKMNQFSLIQKVIDEDYRPSFTVPVKKALKKLVEQCWSKDPNERPTFTEIFNRLAYNKESSIYDVFDENGEEDTDDQTPYFLDDVDIDEFFLYLDIVADNENMNKTDKCSSNELFEKLAKEVEDQRKLISKMQNENSIQKEQIQKQSERIDLQLKQLEQQKVQFDKQESQIQQQNERINKQESQIQQQNERINKQESQIQQQNERINKQMSLIRQQNEQIVLQRKEIFALKNKIIRLLYILCNFNKYFIQFQ